MWACRTCTQQTLGWQVPLRGLGLGLAWASLRPGVWSSAGHGGSHGIPPPPLKIQLALGWPAWLGDAGQRGTKSEAKAHRPGKYLRDLAERPREAPYLDEAAEAGRAMLLVMVLVCVPLALSLCCAYALLNSERLQRLCWPTSSRTRIQRPGWFAAFAQTMLATPTACSSKEHDDRLRILGVSKSNESGARPLQKWRLTTEEQEGDAPAN